MKTIPFKKDHLDLIDFREFDEAYTIKQQHFYDGVDALVNGVAITAIKDGRILGCGGIVPLRAGLGYAWLLGSKHASPHALVFTRYVVMWLNNAMDDLEIHRLQTTCHCDDAQGQTWVETLGFAYEGMLCQYGEDRSDWSMYAKVRLPT